MFAGDEQAVGAGFDGGPRRRTREELLPDLVHLAEQVAVLDEDLRLDHAFEARAGILDGYRCTLHWENIPDMHDEFPHLVVSSGLFELDRDRYTCSGGTAPIDMMLTLIAQERGRALSDRISEGMLCERIRDGSDRQRMPLRMRLGSSQPKLVD